ncbi:MAG: glycosyltransferase family 4 protein [Actinomycetota bacterium]
MRVAFVVQRYGPEVAGGAEALCRRTAQALADAGDDVHVYTTTARDYLTWAPHYDEGVTQDGAVTVHRHAVDPPDPHLAADLARMLAVRPDQDIEARWARAQGPVTRGLLADLQGAARRHEVVALWTYLYATTQLAMPLVADRAVLVPLAHDEPMLRFGITRGVARLARGLAFLTPEERELVDHVLGIGDRPHAIVGAGIDPPPPGDPHRARRLFGLPPRFALYVGRVDGAKGVDALVRHHQAYRDARGRGDLGLVLAGRPAGDLRLPDWVIATGFVDEAARADLYAAADVVVLPSPWESLSLVALEAWQARRPTLAYARSDVLAGQTARSGGGLLYTGADTYAEQLARLAANPDLRGELGDAGHAYALRHTWPACVDRWHDLLDRVRRPLTAAAAPPPGGHGNASPA